MAEQAKILFDEAEEDNLARKVKEERSKKWYSCSLCEQHYHGVVKCALGWACSFARKTCGARERCSRFLGQELERKKKSKRRSTMLSTGKASVFRTTSSDRARLRMFAQNLGDARP